MFLTTILKKLRGVSLNRSHHEGHDVNRDVNRNKISAIKFFFIPYFFVTENS